MKAEFEIIALMGTEGNYKLRIRKLSDNSEKDFTVTDTFVQLCEKRYPSTVFQRFKDINEAIDWENSTVDSTKLLECIEKFNEDVRSANEGYMSEQKLYPIE